jgi:hypothetical protein
MVAPIAEGWLNGFDAESITGFSEGAVFAPMIGTIAFMGYIFTLPEGADVEAFKTQLTSTANLRWNICTEADEMVCDNVGNKVFFVIGRWLHCPIQDTADGAHSCHHSRIPVVIGEMLHHILLLYAFTYCIGQNSLETVSRRKLHTAFTCYQQHDKSVVTSLLPYTVLLPQAIGEVETVTAFNIRKYSDKHLYPGLFLKREESAVYRSYHRGRKDVVGITHIPCTVLKMHHRNILDPVYSRMRDERSAHEQQ